MVMGCTVDTFEGKVSTFVAFLFAYISWRFFGFSFHPPPRSLLPTYRLTFLLCSFISITIKALTLSHFLSFFPSSIKTIGRILIVPYLGESCFYI